MVAFNPVLWRAFDPDGGAHDFTRRPENVATEVAWATADGRATIHHGDCLDVMRSLPNGSVDAVVTDPPYGMAWDTNSTRFSGGVAPNNRKACQERGLEVGRADWGDVEGDDAPFDPTPWLRFPRVVLFGANHYAARLPVGTTLVWVKKADHLFGTFLSDAEVAWMKGGYGVYCYREQFPPPSRMRENFGAVAHPCQKPIGLMRWCLRRAGVEPGMTVLDPYMGSGTTLVAALQEGCRAIGIERKSAHVETAKVRVAHEAAQGSLFK